MKKFIAITLTLILCLGIYNVFFYREFTGWKHECKIIYTNDSLLTFEFVTQNNRFSNQTLLASDFRIEYEYNDSIYETRILTINLKESLEFNPRQKHTFLLQTAWPPSRKNLELYFLDEELFFMVPLSWGMGDEIIRI